MGKKRQGYDVTDYFRDNPTASLNDLINNVDSFHPPDAPLEKSPIKRVWMWDEITAPGAQIYTRHEPAADMPETTSYRLAKINGRSGEPETEDIGDLLQKSKPTKTKPARVLKTNFNLHIILSKSPEWKDAFRTNERDMRLHVFQSILLNPSKTPIPFTDVHATSIQIWLEQKYMISWSTQAIFDVVHMIGAGNSYDDVRDYFESLEWDHNQRAETWLIDYAGADDSQYTRAVSKRFLISVVARTFEPGCKVDTVLILSGPQGVKKSTLFNVMANRTWFTDHLSPLSSKDAKQELAGPMIIELAELDALSKRESNEVKAFITAQKDRYRLPYGRVVNEFPRRCVLVGTTNESGFLKDPTGGRRFWPVSVGNIDISGLSAVRSQLWAEAVEWYKLGIGWWLTDEEEVFAKQQQESVIEIGAFDDIIYNYVMAPRRDIKPDWWKCFGDDGKRNYLVMEEVKEALGFDNSQWSKELYRVKKSVETVIGGNELRRGVFQRSDGINKLRYYVIPDEFKVKNYEPTLQLSVVKNDTCDNSLQDTYDDSNPF